MQIYCSNSYSQKEYQSPHLNRTQCTKPNLQLKLRFLQFSLNKNELLITSLNSVGLHVTFIAPFFSVVKNGLNEFLWCCSHMTLQTVKKFKGAADKDGLKILTCKQGLYLIKSFYCWNCCLNPAKKYFEKTQLWTSLFKISFANTITPCDHFPPCL